MQEPLVLSLPLRHFPKLGEMAMDISEWSGKKQKKCMKNVQGVVSWALDQEFEYLGSSLGFATFQPWLIGQDPKSCASTICI